MVTVGPLVAVLLKRFLISSEGGVFELESVLSVTDLSVRSTMSGLESLLSLKLGLEVHPVLCGATETTLLIRKELINLCSRLTTALFSNFCNLPSHSS